MNEFIKKVSKQSMTVPIHPDLQESRMKVIQSKMVELENQNKSLLSLTEKRQVVLEDYVSFCERIKVS